jgi:hypothetical protein
LPTSEKVHDVDRAEHDDDPKQKVLGKDYVRPCRGVDFTLAHGAAVSTDACRSHPAQSRMGFDAVVAHSVELSALLQFIGFR